MFDKTKANAGADANLDYGSGGSPLGGDTQGFYVASDIHEFILLVVV